MHRVNLKYKRILLKLSGEALVGSKGFGIDFSITDKIITEIVEAVNTGLQIGIVIGGGNIFRGLREGAEQGMDRVAADTMGMLATVMNGLALKEMLSKKGAEARVMNAIAMESISETFVKSRAVKHLQKGRIVIIPGGTGNPFFTTDTAGVLRALEIEADAIFKATKVDGVFDKDPEKYKDAKKYESITYDDVLVKHLKVMDAAAIALCYDNNLPLLVFNIMEKGNLLKAITGEKTGTLVTL